MLVALAALAASLLALHVIAHTPTPENSYCGTRIMGITEGPILLQVQLPDATAEEASKTFFIDLPDFPCGTFGFDHVGTKLTVCDQYAKPSVFLATLRHADLHRLGPARAPGTVHTTVYCTASVPLTWFGPVRVTRNKQGPGFHELDQD